MRLPEVVIFAICSAVGNPMKKFDVEGGKYFLKKRNKDNNTRLNLTLCACFFGYFCLFVFVT